MTLNEAYVVRLLRLIANGVITVEDIKDAGYKAEVEARLQEGG